MIEEYKFKFNRKSLVVTINPNLTFKNQTGWMSVALQAGEQIEKSSIFMEDDKKRIATIKLYQIYKMLHQIN